MKFMFWSPTFFLFFFVIYHQDVLLVALEKVRLIIYDLSTDEDWSEMASMEEFKLKYPS